MTSFCTAVHKYKGLPINNSIIELSKFYFQTTLVGLLYHPCRKRCPLEGIIMSATICVHSIAVNDRAWLYLNNSKTLFIIYITIVKFTYSLINTSKEIYIYISIGKLMAPFLSPNLKYFALISSYFTL